MIGTLTESQISSLFERVLYAHLGCHFDDRIYVVPISFVRKGKVLYGHTTEGLKVELMRQNPRVCIQVDEVKDLANWESAIIWGDFAEVGGQEEIEAMIDLIDRYGPIFESIPEADQRGRDMAPPRLDGHSARHVIYRVDITDQTGRFESSDGSL